MTVKITSLQNSRIKRIVKLRNRRVRDSEQVTIVEGVREIRHALDYNHLPKEAYVCREIAESGMETAVLLEQLDTLTAENSIQIFDISKEIYAKIAYREESGGILLIIPYWSVDLDEILLKEHPFILVVENPEKPGNLGAILRTADAVGIDALFVCNTSNISATDVFNPNVIRASLGAAFTIPIVVENSEQAVHWLCKNNIQILAATPNGDHPYTAIDMTHSIAIVTGSEAYGLSSIWLSHAQNRVIIPMLGAVDSLNLSVSTAVLLYEVLRQRSSHTAPSMGAPEPFAN